MKKILTLIIVGVLLINSCTITTTDTAIRTHSTAGGKF